MIHEKPPSEVLDEPFKNPVRATLHEAAVARRMHSEVMRGGKKFAVFPEIEQMPFKTHAAVIAARDARLERLHKTMGDEWSGVAQLAPQMGCARDLVQKDLRRLRDTGRAESKPSMQHSKALLWRAI